MGSLLLTLLLWRGCQTAATPMSAGDEIYTNEIAHTTMASGYRHLATHFLMPVAAVLVATYLALALLANWL